MSFDSCATKYDTSYDDPYYYVPLYNDNSQLGWKTTTKIAHNTSLKWQPFVTTTESQHGQGKMAGCSTTSIHVAKTDSDIRSSLFVSSIVVIHMQFFKFLSKSICLDINIYA
jgi:hypothetical protein